MDLYPTLVARAEQSFAVHWYRTRLQVATSDPEVHRHLASQHHLVAPTHPVPAPYPVVDVHAVADPDLLDRLRLGAPTARRQAFTGEWYAEHPGTDGGAVLVSQDTEKHPHALVTPDFRSWAVLARTAGSLGLVATRVIRELVREAAIGDGALMFHGAAAELPDGRGVFLAGASASGKTSAAMWLGRYGGRVIGTDRTFLMPTDAGWLAVGLPVSTRLGAGSVAALGILPALRDRAPVRAINPFQTGTIPTAPAAPLGKVWLSNAEVREILGSPFTAATRADILVVLDGVVGSEPAIERLGAAEATAALRAHLLAPDPDYRSRWLARDPSPEPAQPAEAGLAELLRTRTVTRLRWDPSRHCDARVRDLVCTMDLCTMDRVAAPTGEVAVDA